MEERLKSLMVVSSFQAKLDSKMDDEWKGGQWGGDNKKTKGEEVWAGRKDNDSYCS